MMTNFMMESQLFTALHVGQLGGGEGIIPGAGKRIQWQTNKWYWILEFYSQLTIVKIKPLFKASGSNSWIVAGH